MQVVAALGAGTSARLAEEVLENIVEDVAESTLSAEIESLRSLRSTGMAEGIVPPTFFLVADDLVGFVQLFEFFFRGFLVIGMISLLGRGAVLPMACVYCFLHFGKPMGEAISSIFGGYILGVVAYETRGIWGGVIVHVGIAWLMELAAFTQKLFKAED